ncbi:hypothetical protein MNV49_006160 [Pseudohyphozyma bogoriensis]|nr:hypothetical protein MNV49_006160 [Pseudohyphozyma bogoriensis]
MNRANPPNSGASGASDASSLTDLDDIMLSPEPEMNLLNLPRELLAHIVLLAKESDSSYRQRKATRSQAETRMVAPSENEWTGRSLNALFMTCKTFHDLAATHLFSVLRTSTASKPIWKFDLEENYRPHTDEQYYSMECLKRLAARVPQATFIDFHSQGMLAKTLALFNTAERISISTNFSLKISEEQLTSVFSTLSKLKLLWLESRKGGVSLPSEWTTAPPLDLTSLRLHTQTLTDETWAVVQRLGAQLRHLHLRVQKPADTVVLTQTSTVPFPQLLTLHVTTPLIIFEGVFPAFQSAPLVDMSVCLLSSGGAHLKRNPFLQLQNSLQSLQITHNYSVPPRSLMKNPSPDYLPSCPSISVSRVGSDPFRSKHTELTRDRYDRRIEALKNVVEFGSLMIDRCQDTYDEPMLRALFKALEPLRGLQYLQQLD